jgi:aminomuconate-semialdehyde/2-hydroxymuconate-6-semialdehyde dehydrogenase
LFRWSRQTAVKRAYYLNRIADLIQTRLEDFARAESLDQGKPLWLARTMEIPRAIDNFRFFATALMQSRERSNRIFLFKTKSIFFKFSFTQHGTIPNVISYTIRNPVGVAVLISPWNLPLYLLTWKIAPCIAFGCTCVCKPSEFTSVTAGMLAQVFLDAGM